MIHLSIDWMSIKIRMMPRWMRYFRTLSSQVWTLEYKSSLGLQILKEKNTYRTCWVSTAISCRYVTQYCHPSPCPLAVVPLIFSKYVPRSSSTLCEKVPWVPWSWKPPRCKTVLNQPLAFYEHTQTSRRLGRYLQGGVNSTGWILDHWTSESKGTISDIWGRSRVICSVAEEIACGVSLRLQFREVAILETELWV